LNRQIKSYSRIVIKIGSALLVDQESGLRRKWLDSLAADIAELKQAGTEVLIVSSGAIALGRRQLKDSHSQNQLRLEESQAAAAIGQISLSRTYSELLDAHGLITGQILLTVNDTETRRRYLNARATIETLLDWNAVPIINENDSVATTEIRFGDNDRLAARVASMVGADLLILFSDVDGLYRESPTVNADAEFVSVVDSITPEIEAMAGDAVSGLSRGGMKTKIDAAKMATASGVTMVIASGKFEHPIKRIDENETARSTWFRPSNSPVNQRKKWIAAGISVAGSITIDEGALIALESGKSLLPAGVTKVDGEFKRGDTVDILSPSGQSVGRGLIQYDAQDAGKVVGLKSAQIQRFLGPNIRVEMIHRNDMVLDQ
jgi:glutamate 5-kinase